ncbi:hypothetical protein [Mesorhizobium loti]|uniref:hypothetical protein n=1 Tax=Rhizobium loti TaxID=381 RepID=UPI0003F9CCDE|nr:hypothetical protein [Mesorhizobium loti]
MGNEQPPVAKRKRASLDVKKASLGVKKIAKKDFETGPNNVRPWETAAAREWLDRRALQLSRSHQRDSSAAASSMARPVTVGDDPNEKVQAKTLPAMRHWKWAAASCLVSAGLILLLGFSVNKSAVTEQMLASAQRELASQRAELEIMQRSAGDANRRAGIAANTATAQKLDLEQALKKAEALKLDLEAAQQINKGLGDKAVVADKARDNMQASLAEAHRQFDVEHHKVVLIEGELTTARQNSASLQTNADEAASEHAKAVKDQLAAEAAMTQARDALENEKALADAAVRDKQVAVATLNQASAALEKERARAEATSRDLERAKQERDAAKQVSAALTASLEQEREKSLSLAGYLSAARKAIDLVKTERRAAPSQQSRQAVAASRLTSSLSQPSRKTGSQEKHKSKAQKSSPGVVATITLPDALLPTSRPLDPSLE